MLARFENQASSFFEKISVHKYRNLKNVLHWHTECEIIHIFNGSATVSINNTIYSIKDGDTAFIGRKDIHYINAEPDSIIGVIKIDIPKVNKITDKKTLFDPILKFDYSIEATFEELLTEIKNGAEHYRTISECIVVKLIAQIFRNEGFVASLNTSNHISTEHKAMLDYIEENYAQITFEDAYRYMNFTPQYFSKLFVKITGSTFSVYINNLRVSSAIAKLSEGQKSISEISSECGFGTIRNFNRVFKNLTGYSPKQMSKHLIVSYKSNATGFFDPTLSCSELVE